MDEELIDKEQKFFYSNVEGHWDEFIPAPTEPAIEEERE